MRGKGMMIGSMAFLTGMLAGAGAGILTAPQPGARTRRHLRHLALDVGDRTTEMIHDAKDTVDRTVRRTRRWLP